MDKSGDILISMLLCGWIRLSPIVNLLYLISYMFIIQYVYTFKSSDVIPWSSGTGLRALLRVLRFYTCLPLGAYIAGQSDPVCLQQTVCSYNIGYACYVTYIFNGNLLW